MEGQTLLNFSNNPFAAPPTPFYATYHTPPYTLNTANKSSWTDCTYHQPLSMSEDVLQMQQQLRFPTPPITPPRIYNTAVGGDDHHQQPQATAEEEHQQQTVAESSNIIKSTIATSAVPLRTQSVIMKIGHDQSPPHHLPADDLPYTTYQTDEDNSDKVESHHHHNHHLQHQHNDTPSSGTSSPTSSNDFVCDWIECGRYFESLELLAIHVTQIHAVASLADGLYYCRWSGCQRTERGFNARYKMLVHVRTHTKEKPHQCHLCDKRFSRAENLKIHIRSHSGEKPYICTFEGCNKAYSNSSDRFKHTRTHSMEKPYMCKVPGCLKRYTDPSSLRKHVKTFKHSMQIMDFKTTTPPPYHQAQQYPHHQYQHHHHQLQNSLDESRFSPLEQSEHTYPSSYHLIMATAPKVSAAQDSFCMAMEEMCHIRATLDCYKTTPTTPADSENYWLQDDTDSRPSLYHSNYTPAIARDSELTMDLSTEKPLDLRVKRC